MLVVVDERGYSNGSSDGVRVGNLEGYPLGGSFGSDHGAEIIYSGGRLDGEVDGKLYGYPLGESSHLM